MQNLKEHCIWITLKGPSVTIIANLLSDTRMCAQPEENKEPCTLRNVVYESECTQCNPPGTRKEAEKEGLEERRERASL